MKSNIYMYIYLAVIWEIGFEYVLNISRVNSVDLRVEHAEQPEGLVIDSNVS